MREEIIYTESYPMSHVGLGYVFLVSQDVPT